MHTAMAELAASQEGLVSIEQLADLGMSTDQRKRLAKNGWIRRVAPGVWAMAGSPTTHRQALRSGLLALGSDACVAFETAAALHDLDRSDPTAVEFLVPRDGRRCESHFVVHHSWFIKRIDVITIQGFRCTSATRTILDLALARKKRIRIEAAIDSAVRLGLSSPQVLAQRLTTLRGSGRWGCRTIDRLLEDSGGHSLLERKFLALVRRAGLPRPLTQVIYRKGDRHVARVDFLFEKQRVVVEVSGGRGHSSPTERARDAQRRNELQDLGLRVYEFTWEQVTQHEAQVRDSLRAAMSTTPPSRTA